MTATASSEIMSFSYNSYGLEPTGFGYKKEQVYDIGIALNSPQVIGKKIVGYSVPVYDSEYVSEVKAWLSVGLNESMGRPSVFNPDVASYDTDIIDGMINFTLPEPYTIPENGIYLGYSFKVSNLPDGSNVNPVAVVHGTTPGGLFIHASESQIKWADLAKRNEYVSPITVIVEGDFNQNAATIQADVKQIFAAKDETSSATITIENWGTNEISSFDYTYTIADKTVEGFFEFQTPIPAFLGSRGTAEIELMPQPNLGDYECSISVTRVNGMTNQIHADVVSIPITVQPFVAQYRPLVEEFTGLGCGWCPRGYVMLEQMKLYHGNKFVAMAYHSPMFEHDAMDYIEQTEYPVEISSFPTASFNRGGTIDPSSIPAMWENSQNINTPAEIIVDLEWADESHTKLVAKSKTRFIYDIKDSDYLLSFALVADGLYNEKWGQNNAYTEFEAKEEYSGPFWDLFVGKESPVYGLTFNDVVVYYPDVFGIDGSLPSYIESDKWYENTFEIEIDKVKNLAGRNVVNDFNKTRVIAMVVNKNGGKPLNCISSVYPDGSFPALDNIESVTNDKSVVKSVFYNLQGQIITKPYKGLFIRKDNLSDGSVQTSKVLF